MKKIYILILSLMAALVLGSTATVLALDTTALDQKSAMSSPGFSTVDNEMYTEQSFIPSVNRLSYVNLSLSKMSKACDINSRLKILSFDRTQVMGEATSNACFRTTPSTKKYDFEPDLDLKPKTRYVMLLEVVTPQAWLQWHHSGSDLVKNPYSRGTAFYGGQEGEFDYNFETWGYNFTTSTPTVPPLVIGSPEAAAATVPKVTVTATIATPTEFQAVYDESTESVNLSWSESKTTDIDGYIVSRSEDNASFTDIGNVTKDVLLTADNTVKTDKTYYYQVKAYKGSLSSTPTNSVSVETLTESIDEANQANVDLANTDVEEGGINVIFFSLGALLLLLAGLLVLIYLSRKKKTSLKAFVKSWFSSK